eukprot:CAMPEP_0197528408 /NCGR_PEP_ID=MMETSP1318-20131121/24978_1 /TAXON_ID=552666 /ORGANISM="Partenskyella glossopodia, Strain RCC365" /LENGTH=307 /DNA_ID=CAMNT_0043083495 /DNA_START=46 /DNA_END=970 /DNA_ORIENTATION=+
MRRHRTETGSSLRSGSRTERRTLWLCAWMCIISLAPAPAQALPREEEEIMLADPDPPARSRRKWQSPEELQRRNLHGSPRRGPPEQLYGLRNIDDNDVERLAMMKKMGFTIQAALQLMQKSVSSSVPDQSLTPKELSALMWSKEKLANKNQAQFRSYRIDGRGRHLVYSPMYYEKLGHVWLTCPKEFGRGEVERQMAHLREKGFQHHEIEVIRSLPHDRRTAIYFVVSNQTLPVRVEGCEDVLSSNDFETTESDHEHSHKNSGFYEVSFQAESWTSRVTNYFWNLLRLPDDLGIWKFLAHALLRVQR